MLVNHGKGMLQPHQITAEYNAAIPEAEREKLKDTAFEDLLRGAQVCITKTRCSPTAALLQCHPSDVPRVFSS
jgi:hypothetical protein